MNSESENALLMEREESRKKIAELERERDELQKKLKDERKAWLNCHRQCGEVFHKAYCPLFDNGCCKHSRAERIDTGHMQCLDCGTLWWCP